MYIVSSCLCVLVAVTKVDTDNSCKSFIIPALHHRPPTQATRRLPSQDAGNLSWGGWLLAASLSAGTVYLGTDWGLTCCHLLLQCNEGTQHSPCHHRVMARLMYRLHL